MNDAKSQSQRIVVTLPYDMYENIKALADFNRRPMAEEVRIAIEDRLTKVKRPKEDKKSSEFVAVPAV